MAKKKVAILGGRRTETEVAFASAVRLRVVIATPTDSGGLTQKSQHRWRTCGVCSRTPPMMARFVIGAKIRVS